MTVNGEPYRIVRLLGHGKGGYSYLAERDGREVVLKQIHHEPCDYYTFGNKIEAERHDYARLKDAGIRIPALLAIDTETERIVKEYIEGETVFEIVRDGRSAEPYLADVPRVMAYFREGSGKRLLVLANYQTEARELPLPEGERKAVLSNLPEVDFTDSGVFLEGYQAVILEI